MANCLIRSRIHHCLSQRQPQPSERALGRNSTTRAATDKRTAPRESPRRPQHDYSLYLGGTTIATLSPSSEALLLFFPGLFLLFSHEKCPQRALVHESTHTKGAPTPPTTQRIRGFVTPTPDTNKRNAAQRKTEGQFREGGQSLPPIQESRAGHRPLKSPHTEPLAGTITTLAATATTDNVHLVVQPRPQAGCLPRFAQGATNPHVSRTAIECVAPLPRTLAVFGHHRLAYRIPRVQRSTTPVHYRQPRHEQNNRKGVTPRHRLRIYPRLPAGSLVPLENSGHRRLRVGGD